MVTFRHHLGTMGARRGPVSAFALLAPCAPGGGERARRSGMHFAISRPRTQKRWPRSDIWSTTWARGTRPLVCVPPRTGTHWYLANCVPQSYVRVMCGHSSPAVVFGCCRAWLCVQGLLALHFSQHRVGTPLGCALRWVPPPRAAITRHLGRLVVAWVPAPGVTPPVVCSVGAPTFEQQSRAIWVAWWLAWVLVLGPPPLFPGPSLFPRAGYVKVS